MPLFILSIAIQVFLVVHILKTGRNTIWVWVVILLPMAGSIAYVIAELVPELMGSRTGRVISSSISKSVNPNKELKEAAQNLSVANTIDNSIKLANELIEKGSYSEAKELYERCRKGIYLDDPDILSGLAKTNFGLKLYAETEAILDELIQKNPEYKSAESHLLYARALEALGESKTALDEYEVLHGYFSGPEAAYHYASLLYKEGQLNSARTIAKEVIEKAEHSGRHYNQLHGTWVKKCKGLIEA